MVTLALAIGANASIFSVVKAVLLELLPFPSADRLVHIGGTAPGTDQPDEFGVPDELYFAYARPCPGSKMPGSVERARPRHAPRGKSTSCS